MNDGQRRLVWIDPRNGDEYEIVSEERLWEGAPWNATAYQVRNLRTGETASFAHEDWGEVQEFLATLVDTAEAFIHNRSTGPRRFVPWRRRNGVLDTVVNGARHLRWRRRSRE